MYWWSYRQPPTSTILLTILLKIQFQLFTKAMASFLSSFDPCKRSATAAAATAPAASGMVCRTIIVKKKHSNFSQEHFQTTWRTIWQVQLDSYVDLHQNIICYPVSLGYLSLFSIVLLKEINNADLCWSKTKPRCQGACTGWFWKLRRANAPVNKQPLLTIWFLQWCEGTNGFWLNESRSLYFPSRICCSGLNILQKKYVNFQ